MQAPLGGAISEVYMIKHTFFFISVAAFFAAASMLAQGPQGPQNREAPAPNVSFERILKANQEPHNWLTYGGSLTSQRQSEHPQINPENTPELRPKWGVQSR